MIACATCRPGPRRTLPLPLRGDDGGGCALLLLMLLMRLLLPSAPSQALLHRHPQRCLVALPLALRDVSAPAPAWQTAASGRAVRWWRRRLLLAEQHLGGAHDVAAAGLQGNGGGLLGETHGNQLLQLLGAALFAA
eukprot:COSAG01_NODE_16724_length_1211_cov_0.939748_1_plen_136_part_00